MPRHGWTAILFAASVLCGCAGPSATEAPTVLRTEDFIGDPATIPTALPASPPSVSGPFATLPSPGAPVIPEHEARQGVREVTVVPGPPATPHAPAVPADAPMLVDAKVGEINGRAIRVQEMFDSTGIGKRLEAISQSRVLTPTEWMIIQRAPKKEATRDDWLALAEALFQRQLYEILRDELLAAEARAALKPEQRMGLKYFVQETTENKRRSLGGSEAELERYLRNESQNAQRFGKDIEAKVLIRKQIEDKVENRMKASWKDIARFYERHRDEFHPPATARFRIIIVPESDTAGVESVQRALEAGEPFEKVASLPANQFAAPGGLFGNGKTVIGNSIADTNAFTFNALNEAARKLTPGKHTPPIPRTDASGKTMLTWLFLESIDDRTRSLSDPDVQLSIADKLNETAKIVGTAAYIDRLVRRATFSDLGTMTRSLVDIAAQRYWPAGG